MADQKKILIVEDELELQRLYMTFFSSAGYVVETASDGPTGYDKMKVGTYDMTLLDIMLPEMDGIQILEKLVAEDPQYTSKHAVILLSNLGQDTLVAKALTLGIKGYLVKSDYSPDQLLKEIQGYLT